MCTCIKFKENKIKKKGFPKNCRFYDLPFMFVDRKNPITAYKRVKIVYGSNNIYKPLYGEQQPNDLGLGVVYQLSDGNYIRNTDKVKIGNFLESERELEINSGLYHFYKTLDTISNFGDEPDEIMLECKISGLVFFNDREYAAEEFKIIREIPPTDFFINYVKLAKDETMSEYKSGDVIMTIDKFASYGGFNEYLKDQYRSNSQESCIYSMPFDEFLDYDNADLWSKQFKIVEVIPSNIPNRYVNKTIKPAWFLYKIEDSNGNTYICPSVFFKEKLKKDMNVPKLSDMFVISAYFYKMLAQYGKK